MIVGEEVIGPPVVAVHRGVQVPAEQLVVPVALKAESFPSAEPMRTTPPATAGEEAIGPPVVAVHSGAQVVGVQLATPFASNASSLPSADPTYATSPTTAGDDVTAPPVAPVQEGASVVTFARPTFESADAPLCAASSRNCAQSHPASATANTIGTNHRRMTHSCLWKNSRRASREA